VINNDFETVRSSCASTIFHAKLFHLPSFSLSLSLSLSGGKLGRRAKRISVKSVILQRGFNREIAIIYRAFSAGKVDSMDVYDLPDLKALSDLRFRLEVVFSVVSSCVREQTRARNNATAHNREWQQPRASLMNEDSVKNSTSSNAQKDNVF